MHQAELEYFPEIFYVLLSPFSIKSAFSEDSPALHISQMPILLKEVYLSLSL